VILVLESWENGQNGLAESMQEISSRISSILFRTGWGLVFCSGGFAQAPNPTFCVDTDITRTEIPVVDTATGQAMGDLRQSDFVVLADDGQPRDIAVFETGELRPGEWVAFLPQ